MPGLRRRITLPADPTWTARRLPTRCWSGRSSTLARTVPAICVDSSIASTTCSGLASTASGCQPFYDSPLRDGGCRDFYKVLPEFGTVSDDFSSPWSTGTGEGIRIITDLVMILSGSHPWFQESAATQTRLYG